MEKAIQLNVRHPQKRQSGFHVLCTTHQGQQWANDDGHPHADHCRQLVLRDDDVGVHWMSVPQVYKQAIGHKQWEHTCKKKPRRNQKACGKTGESTYQEDINHQDSHCY